MDVELSNFKAFFECLLFGSHVMFLQVNVGHLCPFLSAVSVGEQMHKTRFTLSVRLKSRYIGQCTSSLSERLSKILHYSSIKAFKPRVKV